MELVVDFLLLAASGTAGLFCWVLSRKLKALTSVEAGLGAGVAALSQSAEEMKTTLDGVKTSAEETAARVEALLAEADEKAAHLKGLIEQLGEMSASVAGHAERATRKYLDTLAPFLEEANQAADRLIGAIAQSSVREEKPARRAKREKAEPAARRQEAKEEFYVIDESNDATEENRAQAGAAA